MDLDSILAEAHARADANNDGKLSLDDLRELAHAHNLSPETFDNLRAKADANGDGHIDPNDLKTSLELHSTDIISDMKNKFFGQ
jgi:Ca2+-binding EF-hand superfamily protein